MATLTDTHERSAAAPFDGLNDLRIAHNALLRQVKEGVRPEQMVGDIESFVRRARTTGMLLDENEHREAAQGWIDYWAATMYRARIEISHAVLDDFVPPPSIACPYVGLDAFGDETSIYFFGRRRLQEAILQRLRERRFVAVFGQSGSGKSSVVLGGAVPMLRAEEGERWRYLPAFVPGSEPLINLARLFRPGDAAESWLKEQAEAFCANSRHLLQLLAASTKPALIVVDQFEELFTLCDDEGTRRAFAANLAEVINAPGAGHSVILTMRSDYDLLMSRLPELHSLIEKSVIGVLPLTDDELREAIVQPATVVGLKLEEKLVEELVRDIRGEAAALPLLQFTLLKLWELRVNNRLTLAAYHRIGGGRQALARSADEFYERLFPDQQSTARRILLRIVRPSSGVEMTRNRIRKSDLFRAGEDRARVDHVLQKLVDAHLLRHTKGEAEEDDQIEVAHEALVRNWPRLVSWLEEERDQISTRRRLEGEAAEWIRLDRRSGFLDDLQLREAQRWLVSAEARDIGYDRSVQELVDASEQVIVRRRRIRFLVVVLAVLAALVAVHLWNQRKLQVTELQTQFKLERKQYEIERLQREQEKKYVEAITARNTAIQLKSDEISKRNEQISQQVEELEEQKREMQKANRALTKAKSDLEIAKKEKEKMLVSLKETIGTAKQAVAMLENERSPGKAMGLQGKLRPVKIGASVSALDGQATGSLCCFVKDAEGETYLLGRRVILSDTPGTAVIQPGSADGGTEEDKIGEVVRAGSDSKTSGAIARLLPGVEIAFDIPEIGAITGVAEAVQIDEEIHLIGQSSGVSSGIVKAVKENVVFAELDAGKGDSSAAVVNDDGKLIGLVVGGSEGIVGIWRIQPILDELGVTLVVDPQANASAEAAKKVRKEKAEQARKERGPTGKELGLQDRLRPVPIGASIGGMGESGNTGSLCCFVTDVAGARYLLSLAEIIGNERGVAVVQPGLADNGDAESDKIAVIERVGDNPLATGALARLLPGIDIASSAPLVGAITGVAQTVTVGETLRMIGQAAGVVSGKVLGVEGDLVAARIRSEVGDSGAAVVNERGELVGLILGGDDESVIIHRIQPLLDEFGVQVAK